MDLGTLLLRLGRNVRRARWRKGWTQQDLAAQGFTLRYLAEIERGKRNVSLQLLHQLADVLEVRIADLLDVGERRAPVDLSQVKDTQAPKRGRKPGRV